MKRVSLIFLFLFFLGSFSYAQDFTVDFSSTTGFGISQNQVQLNDINLDMRIVNPLTGETTIQNLVFNVIWQWDQQGLCLRPVGAADTSQGCHNAVLTVNVTNALTGQSIQGATVTVGDEVAQTDENGVATLSGLSEGNVQVTVAAPGFIAQTTSVNLECNEETATGVSLLPSGDTGVIRGDIRIVLTWGENPNDLDSHLTGPMIDGQNRFHVYYAADNNCNGGACDPNVPAWLDVDDTTSYGPETITITKIGGQFIAGTYRYSVHHYSGIGNIAESGAVVKVYVGDRLVRTFYPPTPAPENLGDDWVWTVFELVIDQDGSYSIREVGSYDGPYSSYDVRSMKFYLGVPVHSENMQLFKNLPEK